VTTRYDDGTFNLRAAAYDAGVSVLPAHTKPDMIWVDIETTGLSPKKDLILEIGLIGTDRYGNVIDGMMIHSYPYVPELEHVKESIDSFVTKMHDESGLWSDLETAMREGYSDDDAGDSVIQSWWNANELPVNIFPICGSSVHFDRAFLAEQLPDVEDLFHYRNIDISTLKGLVALVNPGVNEIPWRNLKMHRVIPDILDSIVEYRHYLDHFLIVNEGE
jgi:oligoribonuclease